jgi:flavin-dependent dehydrogenase
MDARLGRVQLANGARLEAPVIIAADGVHSGVARALYGRAHDPARIGFALEVEVPEVGDGTTTLDMTAAPFGYAWDFPKAGGRTLGMGGVAVRNPDLLARFRGWLPAHGVNPDAVTIKGHHLPFGEVRRRPGDGNILFAGDAAGLVDPITGEGIGWAVKSGQLAAEAAIAALGAGTPQRAGTLYCAAMATVLAELGRARLLATVVYHPLVQPRFMRAVARSDHLPRRFLGLLAGEMDYADLGPRRLVGIARRMLVG